MSVKNKAKKLSTKIEEIFTIGDKKMLEKVGIKL